MNFLFLKKKQRNCFDFFFSSRRRHTRWNCDWSSDVCSSDLTDRADGGDQFDQPADLGFGLVVGETGEIGRASWGKSVDLGGRRIIKKKKKKKKRINKEKKKKKENKSKKKKYENKET